MFASKIKLLDTPEHKRLRACMVKKCPEFKKIVEREMKLTADLKSVMKSKDRGKAAINKLLQIGKKLTSTDGVRDKLLCEITKCTKEYIDMQMRIKKQSAKFFQ